MRIHRRQDRAGSDRVHPDALPRITQRQHAGHAGDARLRHDVGNGVIVDRRVRLDRGRRDDRPAPLSIEQMLDGGLRAQEGAAQIDAHHLVVVGDCGFVRRVDDLDAGVVDQDVEAVKCLHHPGEKGIDGVLIGDIRRRKHVAAVRVDCAELLDQLLRRLRIADEVDGDAGALLGKADGGRAPDAGRRARDQYPLAFEPAHRVRLPLRNDARSGRKRQDGASGIWLYGRRFPTIWLPVAGPMPNFLEYLAPVAVAAVAIVLVLGLVNMMRGGPSSRSQNLMRWRVILQFAAVVIGMAALYISQR